jgi:hypothetical protein
MRSSKSRSRGNNKTRNVRPTGGNIINRVFDSSGPDGKVRGTPQQIIEKYTQLHRDAQLSNDRVNAENFAQHAEHYTRLLAEAMREVDRAREEQEQFNRDRQVERDQQMARQSDRQNGQNNGQMTDRERQSERDRERAARLRAQEEASGDPALMDQPYIPEAAFVPDSGLVETPEEVRRPLADPPRGERPPRPDRNVDRNPDRGPRPERNYERQVERAAEVVAEVSPQAAVVPQAPAPRAARVDRGPRPSPVAALLAEVEGPKVAEPATAKAARPRKPKPKPELAADGPAEAAE